MQIGLGMVVLAAGARADLVTFEPVAANLDRLTTIVSTPFFPGDLFVAEQPGRVRLVENGVLRAAPFLDITDRTKSSGFEQGLTGFALPPAFPANPHVYVHYIRLDDASRVARFRLLPGPLLAADPASETELLTLSQPHPTHNCNEVRFGPDGYLYIGCGDGGPPFTPVHDPQSLAELYGKVLRIDVNNVPVGQPYGIPADNPFVGTVGARPEIWALGLRNPYRFSFDALNGDFWLGDVGQSLYEEVDHVPSGTSSGVNFGWNRMEGTHCYPNPGCDTTGLWQPVIEYDHNAGCAVVGGLRMRHAFYANLEGRYVYADFCSNTVYAAGSSDELAWTSTALGQSPKPPTGFGAGTDGSLYMGTYGIGTATLYRIALVDAIFADDFEP
ncbi:MAG TPA: PQQ-dependent sugar dehydrogenase [Tahibacter sp.]|uniref:PQQ-dependent sugar dehydrogenase n=1 Tax=Tahibacter sp. TaxID=2056211 RepID=UPI002C90540D|nr:PQQ-dependent sugar dehydrogenase [Tahibacter sp.]HSX59900.1 PQQ-dependent sugar dehydrogenase [Tahibacter sp.]